jgi:putative transposase
MDFMFDRAENGQKLKILTIIDQYSRFCPGLFVRTNFGVRDVMFALEAAMLESKKPKAIATDNGIEFNHPILKKWASRNGIELFYIRPGKPVDNAYIESFNARLRDECLNHNIFRDIDCAEETIEVWRNFYNEERPHSSLGNRTPTEYMKYSELERRRVGKRK